MNSASLRNNLRRIQRVLAQNYFAINFGYRVVGAFHFFTPVILAAMGLVFQVAAIGLMFSYLKGTKVSGILGKLFLYLNINSNVTESGDPTLISVAVFVMLTLAAISTFFANRWEIKVASSIEEHLMGKLTRYIRDQEVFLSPKIKGLSHRNSMIRTLMTDTRAINRAFHMSVGLVTPLLTLAVSGLVVFYLNWKLSLMLVPIGFIYLISVFRINETGISSSRKFEIASTEIKNKLSEIFADNGAHNNFADRVKNYVSTYCDLILIAHRTNFTNDLTIAISLSFIFFYSVVGYQSSSYSSGYLADVALYLVALRYATAGLKQSTSKFSIMNRFYPQISRVKHLYYFFLTPPEAYDKDPKEIRFSKDGTDSLLTRGQSIFAAGKTQLDRFSILSLISQLNQQDPSQYYREIAIWNERVCHSLDKEDLLSLFSAFEEKLRSPSVHWCLVERSALQRVESSISNIEGLFKDKFIFVNGFPEDEDYSKGRLFLCLDDGEVSWIKPSHQARGEIEGLAKAKEFVFEEFDDVEIE